MVTRARELLGTLEVQGGDAAARAATAATAPGRDDDRQQMSLFTEFLPHPVVEALRKAELDDLTPLAAFDLLRELVARARSND